MDRRIVLTLKGLMLRLLFGRWRRLGRPAEGYSILLPTPMDMPFLLRYALEGLRHVDTNHCQQILVISDGWGSNGHGLRRVVESAGDPRIELIELRPATRMVTRRPKKAAGLAASNAASNTHWATIVEGIDAARCEYCFLHDADAFFLDDDGLERQYRECQNRGLDTLGVEARSDSFFVDRGYLIPGTWELMFSTRWARRRDPTTLKGRRRSSPHGIYVFDNMLYPQYLDFPTGKIGLMNCPPRFAHFSSAVITYRVFRYGPRPKVVDELFRILFLALLEEVLLEEQSLEQETLEKRTFVGKPSARALPSVAELARGLSDPNASVTYDSPVAASEYSTFRQLIEDLCQCPIMQGRRAKRILTLIDPFDEHFQERLQLAADQTSLTVRGPQQGRLHGLG